MKRTLLLVSALLLSSCAQNPPPVLPVERPLPEAITKPPSVFVEGTSTSSLQSLQHNMQRDLEMSLQKFHDDMLLKLRLSLESLKPVPLPTGAAEATR